jgi:hypothetical protein
MSRAKKYIYDGEETWFDYKASVATIEQLELLADVTGDPIDDLLDAGLGQKEVARRLFALDGMVPAEVLERRRLRQLEQKDAPACRWCALNDLECEGYSTKHHFVPRWLMLLLENYHAYSSRSLCTIPICLARHRDLHMRGGTPKSIVACLNDRERAFAQKMLDELREQHPVIFDLMAQGDESSYEATLIRDYIAGSLRTAYVPSQGVSEPDEVAAMVMSI